MALPEIVTTADIAELFDLTTRRVAQLATDGVIEKVGRGKYLLVDTNQRYIQHVKTGGTDSKANYEAFNRARAQLTQANADKTEIELREMRGELLPADEVFATWAAQLAAFRAKVLAMPVRLAAELTGIENRKEIQAIAKRFVDEALTEMAESENPNVESFGFADESEVDVEAAAEPKRRRVGRPKKKTQSGK